MDDQSQTQSDDDVTAEGDPEWRKQTQETNEQAERLAPPRPSGSEEEGTPPVSGRASP